jgi:hypothetical protein
MKRSLRRACTVLAASTVMLAIGTGAAPAFAAQAQQAQQAHKPKLTGDEIVGKAIADLQAASAVRVYARDSELGLTEVIKETYTGQGCLSSISISAFGTDISENVLIVGSSAWVQPGNGFWTALGYKGAELASLEGKWVTFAAFEKLFGISGLPVGKISCNIHVAAAGLQARGWKLVKSAKVSGRWAWRVVDTASKLTICFQKKDCESFTMGAYVSDTRKPEFLSLTVLGVTEHFYDYNASITLSAPPAADVLTSVPQPPSGFFDARSLSRANPLTALRDAALAATH